MLHPLSYEILYYDPSTLPYQRTSLLDSRLPSTSHDDCFVMRSASTQVLFTVSSSEITSLLENAPNQFPLFLNMANRPYEVSP
mmetsp:Transcript_1167/g.1797  ORF Transcript_1167/g.1797 Transcript_1167/m.1797 type:complete len:83 (-) Transcript_1167:434-682(-)